MFVQKDSLICLVVGMDEVAVAAAVVVEALSDLFEGIAEGTSDCLDIVVGEEEVVTVVETVVLLNLFCSPVVVAEDF